jgi:hypothetical protein
LIERSKTEIDKEGWIVLLKMVLWLSWKQNGIFYYTTLTEDVTKENVLIDYILKDEIDDVISQMLRRWKRITWKNRKDNFNS